MIIIISRIIVQMFRLALRHWLKTLCSLLGWNMRLVEVLTVERCPVSRYYAFYTISASYIRVFKPKAGPMITALLGTAMLVKAWRCFSEVIWLNYAA
jgi:hypothetical protein